MCGTLVWKVRGSTLSRPRLSASMPTASRFEAGDVAGAAGGVEQDLGADPAAVGQGHVDAVAAVAMSVMAAPRRMVMPRSRIWWMKSSTISRSTKSRMLSRGLDQRHRHVERGEDRRILDADHPAADHRQGARQVRELEHLVAVEDACAVEGHVVGPVRAGADGDQRVLEGGVAGLAGVGGQLQLVRADEAGARRRGCARCCA